MNLVKLEFKEIDVNKVCPTVDNFSEGVYARTIFMPKGTIIIGKKHKTRHLNIVISGIARVWMDGVIRDIKAPDILESKEGCRKILYIVEDMYWTTIHPTNETDVGIIENMIISEEPLEGLENIIKELQCFSI